ncbi:AP-4 complex subunit beta-1-like [Dreissena polymorpha]|uniref:AP complex subunit beta n=1 Tax=Dreissena polymorpha TaxID=45954 RepID=A0A9D4D5V2_DREPO|nr:AP-4 complex subunit beta-1-like [Dreissena polymorpha]KAH3738672.1 hypothetical protein DPMN_045311 [Dreissena polymorpha]
MENLSIDYILRELSSMKIATDVPRCRHCLSKVLQLCSSIVAQDLSPFLPPVVNLMAHSDLLIKKSACLILTKVSECKSELFLLAVNTLLKDIEDSNPTVRALSLHTLCAMKHATFVEHRYSSVVKLLSDPSAYVRRAAVMSVVTMYHDEKSVSKDAVVVNRLYELVRDDDPLVVVNCLTVLEEILESEGGVVLSRKMVGYLVKRLESFTTWGKAYVMKLLQKYKPKSEEEILDLMNVLDPFLDNNCATISLYTLQFFLLLIKDLPDFKDDVFLRCQKMFLGVFTCGNSELISCFLDYLQKEHKPDKNAIQKLFADHYKVVFCKQKEPGYLKIQKLKLLVELIEEENFTAILEELILYSSDRDPQVSICSIGCLKRLVLEWPGVSTQLLKAFHKLLRSERNHVVSNTLQVLVTFSPETLKNLSEVSTQLCLIAQKMSDAEAVVAVLYLIGQFELDNADSLDVIEEFINKFSELDVKVKTQLLMTSFALFCKQPAMFQPILAEVIDLCMHDDDCDLVYQAKCYFSVLHTDAQTAMKIFC